MRAWGVPTNFPACTQTHPNVAVAAVAHMVAHVGALATVCVCSYLEVCMCASLAFINASSSPLLDFTECL